MIDITHIFRKLKSKITGKPANLGLNDRQQSHQQQQPREINIMNHSANAGFGYYGNHISTTNIILPLLPKFLFEQFSKYANLFFLVTSIIQQVPHVSPQIDILPLEH